MSYICCNYWLVKTFAEPFLNTSHTVQTLIYSTAECAQKCRSKLSCISVGRDVENGDDEVNSKYEDERKGRNSSFTSSLPTSLVAKFFYYMAVTIAYSILLLFIYASFSV
jgi:hypothetical protein